MKTKIHYYYFRLGEPAEAKKWSELQAKLLALGYGPGRHHAWGSTTGPSDRNETVEVEIEPACLFDNQWNTTTDRVFDWYQYYEVNRANLARGHWLELTDEMRAARAQTLKCGYCGKHYGPLHAPAPENGFCDACLDSPYLKEKDLPLLRLRSLDQERSENGQYANRPELTKAEREMLLPKYIERQTTGTDSRAKARRDKQRLDVLNEYEKDTARATTERDGKLWLWDKGIDLDNVIFYNHTGRFCFGWRSPVSAAVESKLLDVLSEFPFSYEIKSETGRKEAA
jgi:hypothetical protein